jgi:hypothetical protein
MNFKELKPNYPIHILDKTEGVKYVLGKVLNVGQPRYNMPTQQAPGSMPNFSIPSMKVDVTIETDGKTNTYALTENVSVDSIGNILFSTDKEGIVRELDATITHCEQYLSEEERVKKDLEESKALKGQLDTSYKDKQETDKRFEKIEKAQEGMGDMLRKIMQKLDIQ